MSRFLVCNYFGETISCHFTSISHCVRLPRFDPCAEMGDVGNQLAFSEELGRLKHIDRKGWVLRGVPNPERVAVCFD